MLKYLTQAKEIYPAAVHSIVPGDMLVWNLKSVSMIDAIDTVIVVHPASASRTRLTILKTNDGVVNVSMLSFENASHVYVIVQDEESRQRHGNDSR